MKTEIKKLLENYLKEKQKEWKFGSDGYNVLRDLETTMPNFILSQIESTPPQPKEEEIEQLAVAWLTKHKKIRPGSGEYLTGCIDGYKAAKQSQPSSAGEPFPNFYKRLKSFVENVQVSDLPGEEEKEMILNVCNKSIAP